MIPERLAFDDVAGVSGEFEAGMPCPADGKLLYKKLPGLTKRQLSLTTKLHAPAFPKYLSSNCFSYRSPVLVLVEGCFHTPQSPLNRR
jgi:hypothetical protein